VIQVFSSHDQAQAQAVLDRLLLADLDAYLSPADVRGVVHYRVRLGPFRDQEQAEAVARQLRQDFQLETWITR
jgi:cell division septation protein DedD